MQHSDFEMPTESFGTGEGSGVVSRADLIEQVSAALGHGDYETAGGLLRYALEVFPDDNRLFRLAAKQRKQEERFTRVYSLLEETRDAMEEDAFVRAVGAFREAANLSRGFADLEEAAFDAAVQQARRLGDKNWRVARSLLEDASRLNARFVVADRLWEELQAAEREETIANVLAETAQAKPDDLKRACERLRRTLEQYPAHSELMERLKSIESTIEEKRKWDDRQTHLRKLTDLRAALQREKEPAQAGKYVRLSETVAAPYGAEPEFSSVIEDIRHQVITCEKASAALEQDRIDDCLEECAWVLSRMRHHQLFIELKQKAEERELALVDQYSTAVSRIREFLDAGDLVRAEKLCSEARAKLPQFTDFLELSREIEQRQKEQDRILEESAESARRLAGWKQEQSKAEAVRWSALNRIANLDCETQSANIAKLSALRSEVTDNFAASSYADVREAAGALLNKIDEKLAAFDRRRERWPTFLKVISVAAALMAVVGLAYWMSEREPPAVPAKPLSVETVAEPKPLPAATPAALDVKLAPEPASVEIRGAAADTGIKMDGVFLGTANKQKIWTKRLAPGSHTIELSRNGYLPKTIARNLAPGELFVLAGQDVRLESSDASTLSSEQQDWNRLGSKVSLPAMERFIARHPNGLHTNAARAKIEELQWRSVDKGDPDSLRGFITKYPKSPLADQAKRDLDGVLMAREAKAEDGDWSATNQGNKSALEDFLRKHPAGRHASAAANALAELESKNRVAEAQETAWKKVNQRDAAALEGYLRDSPSSRYRNEAEAALTALRLNDPSKNDSIAVLAVISRFASAWNTKDLDSILAIQKNLNKRTVKAELAHVKELNMRISPASPPQIDGSQAVVLCRRQASQVFSNGTRKQIPETMVSYVLQKRDGNWTIEGTR